jgi:hypothetical protein
MVLIRIIYYENNEVKQKDIQHTNWQTDVPNTILKLFIEKAANVWREIFGYGGYILHLHNEKYYFGGINNTKMKTLQGESLSLPVETFTKSHPSLKLGIAVTDDVWIEVNSTEWV